MKNKLLYLIFLVLLSINNTAYSSSIYGSFLTAAAFDQVLAISVQTLKEIFPDLAHIKERHYADVIGEIKGVLTTIKDAAEYDDPVLKQTVFREVLTELNQSLERSYSLAIQMTREASQAQSRDERNQEIEHARALERLYKQLGKLKKELHLAFNETKAANNFEREFARNFKKLNQKIIAAHNAPLPLINEEIKKGIFQTIGAVVIGIIMYVVGSLSSQ
jgi:hypothetical protein